MDPTSSVPKLQQKKPGEKIRHKYIHERVLLFDDGHLVTAHLVRFYVLQELLLLRFEYGNWLEEQKRHICELRSALESQKIDGELRILVETSMSHYFDLFRMKAAAAKTNIFYLMSGMWKSPAECFLLVRRVRPSKLLKVILERLMKKLPRRGSIRFSKITWTEN